HFSLCRGTCFSSGHLVAPVFRSLVFLPPVSSSCQDRFAILEKKHSRQVREKKRNASNGENKPKSLRPVHWSFSMKADRTLHSRACTHEHPEEHVHGDRFPAIGEKT